MRIPICKCEQLPETQRLSNPEYFGKRLPRRRRYSGQI